jgi:hypothetical protein
MPLPTLLYFLGTTSIYVHTKHCTQQCLWEPEPPFREPLSPSGHLTGHHPISVQMDNLISCSTILLLTTYIVRAMDKGLHGRSLVKEKASGGDVRGKHFRMV